MQKIIATLTSPEGVVTHQTLVKPTGQPVQLNVPAGSKLDLQVQGQAPGKTLKADAKPDLKLKQVGNKLLVEGDGEVLVEVKGEKSIPEVVRHLKPVVLSIFVFYLFANTLQ